jgi:predicted permease
MNWPRRIFGRRQLYDDLSEEIRAHLDEKVEELVASGMPREEAEHAACREFGNVMLTEENARETWRLAWLENFLIDVRYALRTLRKSPGFSAIAILTLALGIGANTAIFSLLDALVLRPLAVPHPEQLVRFGVRWPGRTDRFFMSLSVPMFREFSREQQVLSSTFAWWSPGTMAVEANGKLSSTNVVGVTGDYFSGWGTKAELGRLIGPEDVDLRTRVPARAAVLSYGLWRRKYGGARNVIGKTIQVEGVPFVVIGVGRKEGRHQGAFKQEVVIPVTAIPLVESRLGFEDDLDQLWVSVEGRMRAGVTLDEARAQLEALWPGIRSAAAPAEQTPAESANYAAMRLRVESAGNGEGGFFESLFARPFYLLLGISALVLLVACLNLASLILARSISRSYEMEVRAALGASGWRLARQVLTESLALSLAGTAAGALLAYWMSHMLAGLAFSPPGYVNVSLDSRVLELTAATAILTGLVSGLVPSWRSLQSDPSVSLKTGVRTLRGGTGRLGQGLILMQVALSLALVTSAALVLRSFVKLSEMRLGFRTRGVFQVSVAPVPDGYKGIRWASYYRQLTERVRSLPGVTSVGFGNLGIEAGYVWREIAQPLGAPQRRLSVDCVGLSPGFFRTTGIALIRGRGFTWGDNANSDPVVVVSKSLADTLFPHRDAIGRHVQLPALSGRDWSPMKIVGIASDARLFGARRESPAVLYIPRLQHSDLEGWGNMYVRAKGGTGNLGKAVESAVASLGHEYVDSTSSVGEDVNRSLLRERMTALFAGYFGGLALLLTAIGLYGLTAYSVTRRAREIGLRMALGAEPNSVAKTVVVQQVRPVLLGLVLGVAFTVGVTRLIAHTLFGFSPYDPPTLVAAAGVLLVVAALSAYVPARRAMKVDPVTALRNE